MKVFANICAAKRKRGLVRVHDNGRDSAKERLFR